MHWFGFVVLSLAVWRIANMLVNEAGPLDVFRKLRTAAGIPYDAPTEQEFKSEASGFFGTMLSCVWCTSMWVALLFWGLSFFSTNVAFVVALPFAFSAVACLIDRFTQEN